MLPQSYYSCLTKKLSFGLNQLMIGMDFDSVDSEFITTKAKLVSIRLFDFLKTEVVEVVAGEASTSKDSDAEVQS